MNDSNVDIFWNNFENKVTLNNIKFKLFLENYKFFKNRPNKNSSFNLLCRDGIFLEIKDEVDVKDFVLEYIKTNFDPDLYSKVFNMVTSKTNIFKRDFLSMLETKQIKMLRDTVDTAYLFYNNTIVKVTKNTIEKLGYKELDLSVWRDQIVNRNFNECDHHKSQYREFIWLISGGFDLPEIPTIEEQHKYEIAQAKYNSFQSIIGYLLHSYKTSSNNKAIILNDEMISEEPNGRSGKGLFWNALKNLKKVQSIDGKSFSFQKSFAYQSISTDCQVLVFDDVKKNFEFENLFSIITEGISIEYKNKDLIQLPIEESPKILITTNYTIKGDGGSHEARKFEVSLSTFFNSKYTPEDYFKGRLFDDWDDAEWSRFDNYMIECLKKYLNYGLIKSEHENLKLRKMIDKVGRELIDYIENITSNEWKSLKDIYDGFLIAYPEMKKFTTQSKLTRNIQYFLEFHNIRFEIAKSNSIRKIIIYPN